MNTRLHTREYERYIASLTRGIDHYLCDLFLCLSR
jgi:hypothetical protein